MSGVYEREGDADLAVVGALLAEPARCRILLALETAGRCPRADWLPRPA